MDEPTNPPPAEPQPTSPPPPPLRRRWPRRLVAAVIFLSVAGVAAILIGHWWGRLLNGPVARGEFQKIVTIPQGASFRAIVEELRDAGLLPHPFALKYLAWRRGDGNRLKPGRYTFHSKMNARQIYDQLLTGAPIRVLIPEGWTLRQIAKRLHEESLIGKPDVFLQKTRDPRILGRHGVQAESAEGYLYPETYSLDPGGKPEAILDRMLSAFGRHYGPLQNQPRPQLLTWHQVLTLASMIEREARKDDEKPVIASVYYNRLQRKMLLECDATVRYALNRWDGPLTKADLENPAPYNTYVHPGLPPGPICTVSESSLRAALSPAQTKYLFYVHKGDNSHYFSSSGREHMSAVRRYLRKRLTPEGKKK